MVAAELNKHSSKGKTFAISSSLSSTFLLSKEACIPDRPIRTIASTTIFCCPLSNLEDQALVLMQPLHLFTSEALDTANFSQVWF